MSKSDDALKVAEAALTKVHDAEVGGAVPVAPVKPSKAASAYLGHIGEPAVKGKDFA